MTHLRPTLILPLAIALCAAASLASAQTTPAYKYSVVLTAAAPKGSASEAALKDKTLPTAARFSPCTAGAGLDALAFTIKYDAGKPATTTPAAASTLKDVYLVFHKDGAYFPLVRQPLTQTGAFFKSYNSIASILPTDAYTLQANNVGGLQTEVVLGGNLSVEGLDSGVWHISAIIADATTVNFDDPATWAAWDTLAFVLRKPWRGAVQTTCE